MLWAAAAALGLAAVIGVDAALVACLGAAEDLEW